MLLFTSDIPNLTSNLENEHQRAIKFQPPEKSALCQHSMENDHLINSKFKKWNMITRSAFILKVDTRGGVLEDVLGLEDVLEDTF